MKKPSTALSRVVAFTSLVAAALVLIVVVATSLDSASTTAHHHHRDRTSAQHRTNVHIPATYVVQSGDTLTSIAHHLGVPVVTIKQLNPGLDPQILVTGQKLKLRETR
jgi:LysM repeat protein